MGLGGEQQEMVGDGINEAVGDLHAAVFPDDEIPDIYR